jgi:Zn-finger nucleic acid-binding protein
MHRTCVKCTSVLDKSMVGDIEVDLCPSCGGLWLDRGELEKIGESSQEDLFELRQSLAGSTTPEAPSETSTHCPACDGTLKELKLGMINIDFCGKCEGLFLDKGELDQALASTQGLTLKQVIAAAAHATGALS